MNMGISWDYPMTSCGHSERSTSLSQKRRGYQTCTMTTGLKLSLTNEDGLQGATIKAKQTRLLFYLSNGNHFTVILFITLHTWHTSKREEFLLFMKVSEMFIYQIRDSVVKRTEKERSKKYHQQPFSNQPPPLTFHHLPVILPNYGSIKALIHSLILVIYHLATPSQTHPEVCFSNHISSSQLRQPEHQN